jgi:adenylate cyclase
MALAYAGKGEDGMASLNDALRLSPRDQFNFLWLYLLGFAAFIAERYQEALEFTTQSIRENASLPGVHRVRAACLSQLGRIEEARSAIADFRRLAPGATIDALKRQMPFKRPEDLQRYIELLQRAGMTH